MYVCACLVYMCVCVWCWVTHPPSLPAWWCVGSTPALSLRTGRLPAPVLLPRQSYTHRCPPSPSAPAPRTASLPAVHTHTKMQRKPMKTTHHLPMPRTHTHLSKPKSGLNSYTSKKKKKKHEKSHRLKKQKKNMPKELTSPHSPPHTHTLTTHIRTQIHAGHKGGQINHKHGVKTQVRLLQPLSVHALWGLNPGFSLPET